MHSTLSGLRAVVLAVGGSLALSAPGAEPPSAYRWAETPGKHTDLLAGDRPVVRYVHETFDGSTPERREQTHKPFHHVFSRDGKVLLTKGPGGQFSHHRGIFFGFSKCGITAADGSTETVDSWHSRKARTEHVAVLEQGVGPQGGFHAVRVAWVSDAGGSFLDEVRRLTFSEAGADLTVDFESTLSTTLPAVTLDGDPQHAGFHFRAAAEVHDLTKGQTYFVRPGTGRGAPGQTVNWSPKDDLPSARDLPWKGMSVVVGGARRSVAYLDHPSNPKPARFSERDYGRFGSYFVARVTPEKPLRVRYRLVIRDGEFDPEEIGRLSASFVAGP
jgi:hypothetical protein